MNDFVPPGLHLIIDIKSPIDLTDLLLIENCLKECASACQAKILESSFHSFGENAGVTGVVVLAESHISIHTWPEISYAAVDIFMCGECNPQQAIPVLERYFKSQVLSVRVIERTPSSLRE